MKPTRSAKRTETSRRSAAGAAGSRVAGARRLDSAVPHSPQNRCPGGLAAPQDEQTAASAFPHSPQNFCPAGFSAPQLVQVTSGTTRA